MIAGVVVFIDTYDAYVTGRVRINRSGERALPYRVETPVRRPNVSYCVRRVRFVVSLILPLFLLELIGIY